MDLNERVTRVWHGLFESVERNDAAGVRSALDEMHALNSEIRAENEPAVGLQ